MWSYVPLEQRIPADHPLRALQAMVDTILSERSPQFDQLYSKVGRPSNPARAPAAGPAPAGALQRAQRAAAHEQLDYNLLFRWFVGLAMDDPIWDATVFTKNRETTAARRHRARLFRAGSAPRPSSGACCPTSTSRSTAP